MIIKVLILTTFLNSEYNIVAMPTMETERIEASRKRGKRFRDRRRGGNGLR